MRINHNIAPMSSYNRIDANNSAKAETKIRDQQKSQTNVSAENSRSLQRINEATQQLSQLTKMNIEDVLNIQKNREAGERDKLNLSGEAEKIKNDKLSAEAEEQMKIPVADNTLLNDKVLSMKTIIGHTSMQTSTIGIMINRSF